MTEVTICIPAWQAEAFIGRTLRFATGQTHAEVRILVSVDRSTDSTADICAEHARHDPRIVVFEQKESLGWAGNMNCLLDRVETELFFVYFHDDVIVPQYTERLLGALGKHPNAMSAHCDMGHFGGSDRVVPGRSYSASPARRLMGYLITADHGPPLRGLTRSEALAGGVRVPTAARGMFAAEPYVMRLLASGPAAHLGEALYLRWDKRAGGVTEDWKRRPPADLVAGLKANAACTLEAIEAVEAVEEERRVLVFLAMLRSMLRVRNLEGRLGERLVAPDELHPAFASLSIPADLGSYGGKVERWAHRHYEKLAAVI